MTLFDDEHTGCPVRIHDEGAFYECGLMNENCFISVSCHEANCPVYFWIEKFAERLGNGSIKQD